MSTILQSNPATVAQGESTAAGPVLRQPRFPAWLIAALLGMATLALYWPATRHEFINYDDQVYVTDNIHVRTGLSLKNIAWAFANPVTGNWHPLTMISHMLDCQLFGLKPWGHHLTSLGLHALNTMLVFWWLRELTGAVWRSALVAALFGWHPVNVESVAWVAERKSVLSLCFGLLALLFYTRYAQSLAAADPKNSDRRAYWLAWLCLAAGLMCKSILVTWPFVFFLLDYWPLGRFASGLRWPAIREKIPFFMLVAAVSVATVLTHRQEGDLMAADSLPLGARVENALISYVRYLGKLFWPANLAAFYPHPGYWPLAQVLLATVFLAGVTVLLLVDRRRHLFLLMGWLWFLGSLVPVIGLVQVGSQAMADRHAYIPELGILIMTVWGGFALTNHWRAIRAAMAGAALATLILCLILTRHQLQYWQNDETLFQHTLAVTRDNYVAHSHLGSILLGKGQTDAAINEFREVLRLKPNFVDAHYNLANALLAQGKTNAAISEFQADLRLKPDDADAHYKLGDALLRRGQTDAAISQFQAAFRLKTYDVAVYYDLGNLLAKQGQVDAAIAQFQEAIRLQPDNVDAHNNLGSLLLKTGQIDPAIGEFQAAVRLEATNADAHYNLANALLKTGRVEETISEFKEAIRLKPDYAPAHYNLGVAWNKKGQSDAAIGQFEEAIRLEPDYAIAHNSLGVVLAAQGRLDDAINQFQTALRIKPDYAGAQNNLARAQAFKNQPAVTSPAATKP